MSFDMSLEMYLGKLKERRKQDYYYYEKGR